MMTDQSAGSSPPHQVGVDYLKAFASLIVVAIHLGSAPPYSRVYAPLATSTLGDWCVNVLYFYIMLAAVPVFYATALYLFLIKPRTWRETRSRLVFLAKLLVFWTLAYRLFSASGWTVLKGVPVHPVEWLSFISSAWGTIYFFLVGLIVLTAVAQSIRRITWRAAAWGFGLGLLYLLILPILCIHRATPTLIAYWSLLNFLPYPFAVVFLLRLRAHPNRRFRVGILGGLLPLLTVVAILLDWTVLRADIIRMVHVHPLPAYARPSLVLLATLILAGVLDRPWPRYRWVEFLAHRSLALYCLHPFFISVALWYTRAAPALVFPVVVLASYVTVALLRGVINHELLGLGQSPRPATPRDP